MKISKLKDVIYELVNVAEYEFTPTYFKNIDNACVEICEKLDKLADYEDKQEQGLLLELPCKVGDTVYSISREEIIPVLVDGFGINENGLFICGTNEEHFGYSRLTPPAKNLYLTRSEAEEALSKMGGK